MESQYSESKLNQALLTLVSIKDTIETLISWNDDFTSSDDYYESQHGMQILTANCTLITAIGEGINRINRLIPGFLQDNFPDIPWRSIIGMRNHIAHGYFELDAEIVFCTVNDEIPLLLDTINDCIVLLKNYTE